MKSGVYSIVCRVTGKRYIGSAANIHARWSVHRHLLRKGSHHSKHLQRAWDKHGERSFMFEVVELVQDCRLLIDREQYHIDAIRPFGANGYNIALVAGRTSGVKRTEQQIEAMASRFRGKKLTDEHKKKIGASLAGKRHRPETLEKMRAARLANNHQVGRPLTEKQKVSLHRSGECHPWFGRAHSDAARKKISENKSIPIDQIGLNGEVVAHWRSAAEAASQLGLRSADSIYRSIVDPRRKAAGFHWRRVTDRAVIS